ncbi:hypothetical protein [Streptomyces sp. NPDC093260]|uniref:hypothetical protein n=1 Tax=Streptomyces sp. NPDC093260 TaxID=3155073 RepID=UPI003428C53E
MGRRFGRLTGALFPPVRPVTWWTIVWHRGVTWASLAEPGHGGTPAAELCLSALVMLAAAAHGWAYATGRPARSPASSPMGSQGVVLPATALPTA